MFLSFDRALIALTSVIVVALTALMVVVVLIGNFARYVLNDALPWPEEVARYSMVWLAWIGGGLALRRGAHVATDLVVSKLPERAREVLFYVGNALVLIFLMMVVWYGMTFVGRAGFQTTAALGISMQIPYAAAPIGAALMIYHLLVMTFVKSARVDRDVEVQI